MKWNQKMQIEVILNFCEACGIVFKGSMGEGIIKLILGAT